MVDFRKKMPQRKCFLKKGCKIQPKCIEICRFKNGWQIKRQKQAEF